MRKLRADGAHAVVVVADGGEPALLAAVGDDVHQLAAVLELAELVRRAEGRARRNSPPSPSARSSSVGCPTDSWMVSQRLVGSRTRSYSPGTTGFALSFSRACSRRLRRLADEIVAENVVVAAAARRGQGRRAWRIFRWPCRSRSLRVSGIERTRRLRDPAADARGEKFLLAHEGERQSSRNRRPAFSAASLIASSLRDLLVGRHEERIGLHRHVPAVLVGRARPPARICAVAAAGWPWPPRARAAWSAALRPPSRADCSRSPRCRRAARARQKPALIPVDDSSRRCSRTSRYSVW